MNKETKFYDIAKILLDNGYKTNVDLSILKHRAFATFEKADILVEVYHDCINIYNKHNVFNIICTSNKKQNIMNNIIGGGIKPVQYIKYDNLIRYLCTCVNIDTLLINVRKDEVISLLDKM